MIIAVFASGVLGIVESFLVSYFIPNILSFGKIAFKSDAKVPAKMDEIEVGRVYRNKYGSFKLVSSDACLFYTKYAFGKFGFFPIKGKITFNDKSAHIEGKYYIGILAFLATWSCIFTFVGYKVIEYSAVFSLVIAGGAWAIFIFIVYFGKKFGFSYTRAFFKEAFGSDLSDIGRDH